MWGFQALLLCAAAITALFFRRRLTRSALRAAGLVLGCFIVLAGLELVYVTDRFEGDLVRYNTYFKFCYPLWPLLWCGAWALLLRHRDQTARRLGTVLCMAALAAALVYPVCAWPARLAQSRAYDAAPRRPTLDSVDFIRLNPHYAAEAPMLDWIRRNVPPGDVVLEAPGDKGYEYRGRVASLAGRAVPMGWVSHEYQWRAPDAVLDGRAAAASLIYKGGPRPGAKPPPRLGDGLEIRWAVFGVPEAEAFGMDGLTRMRQNYRVAAAFPNGAGQVWVFDLTRAPDPKTEAAPPR